MKTPLNGFYHFLSLFVSLHYVSFCCEQLSYNTVLCKLGYLNEHAFSLHAHSLNFAILTLTTFSEISAHVYITWSIIRSCYILKIDVVFCHLADLQ